MAMTGRDGKRRAGVGLAILFALSALTQAQAPTALLTDARAELAAAAKALEASDVFQRYQRAKRIAEGLEALAKAEKAAEKPNASK